MLRTRLLWLQETQLLHTLQIGFSCPKKRGGFWLPPTLVSVLCIKVIKQKRLKTGLNILLGDNKKQQTIDSFEERTNVNLDSIQLNPNQPRKTFNKEKLLYFVKRILASTTTPGKVTNATLTYGQYLYLNSTTPYCSHGCDCGRTI